MDETELVPPHSKLPRTTGFGFTFQATKHYNGRVRIPAFHAAILFACLAFLPNCAFADSATWNLNPTSNDWTTAANWTPETVPNGTDDVATFSTSSVTTVSLAKETIEVSGIVFDIGASAFTISDESRLSASLTVSGPGVTNNSGLPQNFSFLNGTISFAGSATAGTNTIFTGNSVFQDTASAGDASFVFDEHADSVFFRNQATAANATFTMVGGQLTFSQAASAGNAVFDESNADLNPSFITFRDNSTAANGNFTANGSEGGISYIVFQDTSNAENATFTVNGAPSASGSLSGSFLSFATDFGRPGPSAGSATIINNGSTNTYLAAGGETYFGEGSSLAQATIIANGGEAGGTGGRIRTFGGNADGGTARVELFGNGNLDISGSDIPLLIGSLEGDGIVYLGFNHLGVGTNNTSTTFSGVIQDGGSWGGTGGSFSKLGSGRLVLTKASTYTGGTTIEGGRLLVENRSGSATGTGAVQVNLGVLGGRGIVAGAVTLGTGTGAGSYLAPGQKSSKPGTLTIRGKLTFQSDGIFACDINSNLPGLDKVVAKSVTITNGATIILADTGASALTLGTVFTIIDNRAATPIFGTFANLPDGGTITAGRNTFQANYEGGDGNDLTLTVVQ